MFDFSILPEKFRKKAEKLSILPDQITEEFIRGSGKGGQKINKTSSQVYLKHIPTAIEVKCQKFREQSLNRTTAYKMLILKIELAKIGKKSEIASKMHKLKKQKQKRSKRAKEKILNDKSIRGDLKDNRKNII